MKKIAPLTMIILAITVIGCRRQSNQSNATGVDNPVTATNLITITNTNTVTETNFVTLTNVVTLTLTNVATVTTTNLVTITNTVTETNFVTLTNITSNPVAASTSAVKNPNLASLFTRLSGDSNCCLQIIRLNNPLKNQ